MLNLNEKLKNIGLSKRFFAEAKNCFTKKKYFMTSQYPSRNHRSALPPQLTALAVSNYHVTETFASESGVVFP